MKASSVSPVESMRGNAPSALSLMEQSREKAGLNWDEKDQATLDRYRAMVAGGAQDN